MELWVTVCLIGVLAAVAFFLIYFIIAGMDMDSIKRVDKVPPKTFD
ncbi:hypothetical protein ACFFF5_09760 [Lederbergia wuyishanensis]|uniref:Uncharacterized protein n=1 Tax=Lederbergia wuyishanensis TaxID=1347903 RepID=A0ABU0D7H5_9BACI|nr:hypothetical protein [Lederbergia wuyishanensis]MCJ8009030.1 hypothetical protein [Lederbergia wuyishanensis]MDQ0344362.1 hypothetical protein [Lederbergia wuyishanensis]